MPQYIQNPSLMGMQEANEQSKQRSNIYAQAIAQATDAINRQAMSDLALQDKMRMARDFIQAGFTPSGQEIQNRNLIWRAPMLEFGGATMQGIQERQNLMAGFNPAGKTRAERQQGFSFLPVYATSPQQPNMTFEEILKQNVTRLAPYLGLVDNP